MENRGTKSYFTGYNKRLQEAWNSTHDKSHLYSSLVQDLTVSTAKRKLLFEIAAPDPSVAYSPPVAGVGAGGSPCALGSTHTYWGAQTSALRARREPAPRWNSGAYRPLSRQLGKNQNHRQQKDQKRPHISRNKCIKHDSNPIQLGIFFTSKGCVLIPQK